MKPPDGAARPSAIRASASGVPPRARVPRRARALVVWKTVSPSGPEGGPIPLEPVDISRLLTNPAARQALETLSAELEEAAAMDGASRFRIFLIIALPLARATTIAAAVLLFTTNWNAFLWPLLITFSEEMKTLPIGMAAFAPVTMNRTQIESYAPGMAAMTILGVPSLIVFLFLQRYFMEGVISTGIKG